ncbi:MAG TPA: EB domain-containing protein [Polyangiaceae bacterium]|nr:EB domain-containing protein [Polyangiaceae bacterium]
MLRSIVLVVALGAFALVACSSEDPGGQDLSGVGGAQGGFSKPASTANEELAQAACLRINECSPVSITRLYGTLDRCAEFQLNFLDYDSSLPGVLKTDDEIRACAKLYATAACSNFNAIPVAPPECRGWQGSLADGEKCEDDAQCAGGYCTAGCGVCVTQQKTLPVGSACTAGNATTCVEGAFCSNKTCVRLVEPGEACSGTDQCALFLKCENGVCTQPHAVGDPCGEDDDCQYGLACSGGKCVIDTSDAVPGSECDGKGFGDCQLSNYCEIPEGQFKGTCALSKLPGEACRAQQDDPCFGSDCINGVCQRDVCTP